MSDKKCRDPLFIFFRINGAGTVHKHTVCFDQPVYVKQTHRIKEIFEKKH